MLDDLAAFVSLTIPTRGEEGEVIVAGALLHHPPLPRCGRGAGGEGHPQRGRGTGGEGSPNADGRPALVRETDGGDIENFSSGLADS